MDSDQVRLKNFQVLKQQCLSRIDVSKKGSIDEPIRDLVDLFNASSNYYTTSTCSGRILLISKPRTNAAIKKGGDFVLNSHDQVDFELLTNSIKSYIDKNEHDEDCLWLKFEPFIMHIQCLDLTSAHSLLTVALAAGCRNSGMTMGKNEKYLVAIRSTSFMEVPLYCKQDFQMVPEDYLKFIWRECNKRLVDNFTRMRKFQDELASANVFGSRDINETTTAAT